MNPRLGASKEGNVVGGDGIFFYPKGASGLLRFARNDGGDSHYFISLLLSKTARM